MAMYRGWQCKQNQEWKAQIGTANERRDILQELSTQTTIMTNLYTICYKRK